MVVVVGLIAGTLTTAAWLPQLWRTWQSRSAEDVSWGYLITITVGFATWLTYGVLADDLAVIVSNVVTLVLVSVLIRLKLAVGPGR